MLLVNSRTRSDRRLMRLVTGRCDGLQRGDRVHSRLFSVFNPSSRARAEAITPISNAVPFLPRITLRQGPPERFLSEASAENL